MHICFTMFVMKGAMQVELLSSWPSGIEAIAMLKMLFLPMANRSGLCVLLLWLLKSLFLILQQGTVSVSAALEEGTGRSVITKSHISSSVLHDLHHTGL